MKIASDAHMKIVNAYKKYVNGSDSYLVGLSEYEADLLNVIIYNRHIRNSALLSEKTGFPLCLCADILLVNVKKVSKSNNMQKKSKYSRKVSRCIIY